MNISGQLFIPDYQALRQAAAYKQANATQEMACSKPETVVHNLPL